MPQPLGAFGDEVLDQIIDRFFRNINRVDHLLGLFGRLDNQIAGRRPVNSTDVLRAAVILLHASLEDFLRSLGKWLLPTANPGVLETIPIVTGVERDRKKSISLGDLAQYRGESIDDFLSNAVSLYLDQRSFNSITEICIFLELINFDINPLRHLFYDLQSMIERRHHIVHQADRNPRHGRGQHVTRSIGATQVESWLHAVEEFAEVIIEKFYDDDEIDDETD
jgi:hypothetical protein